MADTGKKWYAHLFKENIYGLGIQAVTFIAGVLFTVIFPNMLGKEGFGYLSLIVGFVSIGQVFADFGIQTAALRFIPEGSKKGIAWKYFRVLLEWKALLSVAVAVLMFVGADFLAAAYGTPGLAFGIRVGAAFMFLFSMYGFVDNVFVASKRTRNSFIMALLFQGGRIALPLAVFFLIRPDYVGALAGVAAACALALIPGFIAEIREPLLQKGKEGALDMAGLRGYMFYAFFWYAAAITMQWSDTLAVGAFLPVADVAIYRVAWLWATATVFLLPFSQRVFMSAHAYEGGERSRMLLDRTLKYGFVFSFLMMAGIVLVASQFLQFVYGAGYADAYPIMVVLSILTLEMMLITLCGGMFAGKGGIRTTTIGQGVAAVAQVALLVLLTPTYGLMGAAIGVAVARVTVAIALSLMAAKSVSLGIPAGYVWKPALCAGLAVALLLPLKQYTFSIPAALAYGCGAVALYCLLAVALKAVDVREIVKITRGAVSR